MTRPISRRHVLKGIGGLTLSLPLLPSLLTSRAQAAASTPPLRFIAIQNRDGTFESEFWPKQDPTQQLGADVWGHRLSTISGPISNVLSTHFDTLRNKVSVIRGLDYLHFAFHRSCAPFCASENPSGAETSPPVVGSSIDCIMENSQSFYKTSPVIKALRISSGRTMSYWRPNGGRDANVSTMPVLKGSKNVFNYLFQTSQQAPIPNVPTYDSLIMAQVYDRYKAFINQRGLGSLDKQRVQTTADLVNDLQKRIFAEETYQRNCTAPSQRNNDTNNVARYEDYIDSIVAAFACDLTRISTLFISDYTDTGGVDHHSNSHETHDSEVGRANCRVWDGWIAKRVATLMQKLDSVTEADGSTLLDNTVIVWANEDGIGTAHSQYSIPCIVGGGGAGRLKMGYYLDYRGRPFVWNNKTGAGVSAQALGQLWPSFLISVMHAVGVSPADYTSQGDDGGFGQFPNYTFVKERKNAATLRKNPLPFL